MTDYRLLDGDTGTALILQLRDALGDPKLPAILITGDIAQNHRQRAERYGYRLLLKPTDDRLLLKTIRQPLAASAGAA